MVALHFTSMEKTTRFSGADWADQLKDIMIVGVGGIGSWTALNLARIGHSLILVDGDQVDETNVLGGQMFQVSQVGQHKVAAVQATCRAFGADKGIDTIPALFEKGMAGGYPIIICGLDNMAARKLVYEDWKRCCTATLGKEFVKGSILIDGRLTMEMFEVFAIQCNRPEQMEQYEKEHLFSDEEAQILDCTTKQSTFGAMGIAAQITATLCNHLTNIKLEDDFREVPFYQRMHYPIVQYRATEVKPETCLEKS